MSATALTSLDKITSKIARGDTLHKQGQLDQAIEAYLDATASQEITPGPLCLKLSRSYQKLGHSDKAYQWALSVVDAGEDYTCWQSAYRMLQTTAKTHLAKTPRSAKLAVIGSYTTQHFIPLLTLAAKRYGITLEIYESPYGQYRQEILDPDSAMYAFEPDMVLFAVHEKDLTLPDVSGTPATSIHEEVARWTHLWDKLQERCKARIIQLNFAIPPEVYMGHLGTQLPGSRYSMSQEINRQLAHEVTGRGSLVDCDRLAAEFGKLRWFDPRFWHLAKEAVSLEAVPLLAKHTAAVMAANLGLSKKCLVLDLDNTLWGGVIGEDGLAGIKLGNDADGAAFVDFQNYVLQLKNKGVILAVCSKNNEADAKEPFEEHPEMRLKLDDIALFIANWNPKPNNIQEIANTLNIGLDSLVFVDDNPAERESVRQQLPEVEVIPLPLDPAYYTRTLADFPLFETMSFTAEDANRTAQYRARSEMAMLEQSANTIEDFYRSLQMSAYINPFDESNLPRIVQLIGKTNQFNVTTRRYSDADIQSFMANPDCVHLYCRIRDRFTDHGLIGLMIAWRQGNVLDIDTWLMSCRVIGRTVENEMLKYLCRQATKLNCTHIQGTYVRTAKNDLVQGLFSKFGFTLGTEDETQSTWTYNLLENGPIENEFIQLIDTWDS